MNLDSVGKLTMAAQGSKSASVKGLHDKRNISYTNLCHNSIWSLFANANNIIMLAKLQPRPRICFSEGFLRQSKFEVLVE